ncbi:MAG: hypothetical protein ACOX8T_12935 [Bacillota bacterium]|jgi:hypothetical protein
MAKEIIIFLFAAVMMIYLFGWWGVAGVALFLLYAWADGVNRAGKKKSSGLFFWWKR